MPFDAAEGPPAPASAARVVARSGASAELAERDGAELVLVRDARGRVLFEYDAESGRGSLSMPEGDLSLCAPAGAIELVAATAIRCVSAGEVSLRSSTGASIAAGEALLRADRRGVTIAGERLALGARRGEVEVDEMRYAGRELAATVPLVRLGMQLFESAAERVVTRVGDLFQHVEGLQQLRAGRLRALVRDTVLLKGRDVSVRAEQDASIDGERINLG
jgi:hypothetical protein